MEEETKVSKGNKMHVCGRERKWCWALHGDIQLGADSMDTIHYYLLPTIYSNLRNTKISFLEKSYKFFISFITFELIEQIVSCH